MGMLTLNVRKEEKDTIDRRNVGIEYTPRFEEEKKSNDSNENDNEQLSKLGPELDDTHNKSKHSTNRQFSREESFRLERTKEIFHQALMYVGVFYLTWTAPTIGSALRIDSDRIPAYPISVLIILLLSLQGFWNWLIYRRGPCLV